MNGQMDGCMNTVGYMSGWIEKIPVLGESMDE